MSQQGPVLFNFFDVMWVGLVLAAGFGGMKIVGVRSPYAVFGFAAGVALAIGGIVLLFRRKH